MNPSILEPPTITRLFLAVASALSLALASFGAHASAVLKVPGAAINIPNTWKARPAGTTGGQMAVDPKGEVLMLLWSAPGQDLKQAATGLDAVVATIAKNVTWSNKGLATKINGLDAVVVDGNGVAGGDKMSLGVVIVKVAPARVAYAVLFLNEAKAAKRKAEMNVMLHSIRAVR